ncbi:hypothetical protein HYC85_007228 [Camellia sinensis]|uniref:Uncharacterized protein n=1 Tax=Camellia sinensis TaxID=4442 RepID=A0A7J7HNG2_CAMSI|nr:hypothetical protein HYC85_007228 [Camellia sinensis]
MTHSVYMNNLEFILPKSKITDIRIGTSNCDIVPQIILLQVLAFEGVLMALMVDNNPARSLLKVSQSPHLGLLSQILHLKTASVQE